MTFSAYVARQFLGWWFSILLVLIGLIALFDTIELMRRTSGLELVSFLDVLTIMLFKLPHMAQKAVPFTVLFGAMVAFWRLNRHQELIVARAAGVSAWEFIAPVMLLAIIIGVVKVTVYGPFASAMMVRYEQLDAERIRGKPSLAALSGRGIWLRQAIDGGHYILHAASIEPATMKLDRVIVFRFTGRDRFTTRVDAGSAVLEKNWWRLDNVRITGPDRSLIELDTMRLETDLTMANIQDSFAKPETMSFWALPRFIEILEKAGFSGLRHRLYWYSQLGDPLLLIAMVLFAAGFTLRPLRRGGTAAVIGAGVATGFLIYFTTDVAYALGLSARLPAMLAAWSPAIVGCLLGAGLLFHLEDG